VQSLLEIPVVEENKLPERRRRRNQREDRVHDGTSLSTLGRRCQTPELLTLSNDANSEMEKHRFLNSRKEGKTLEFGEGDRRVEEGSFDRL